MINTNVEHTAIDSYNLVFEADGLSSAPTSFPLGVSGGDMDLLSSLYGGTGHETSAYRLEILITGKPSGSGTVVITGACEGGPEEFIASLDITIGSTTESGDWKWADTIALTSYHLSGCSIAVADSGNSRPCKFGFDAVGYRYINFYVPSLTTVTDLRIYARFF